MPRITKEVADAVKAVESSNSTLHKTALINAAKDPKNPTHGFFTWDDTEAAHKRRMDEASHLINLVRIEWTEEEFIPAYVPHPEHRNTYINIQHVKDDPEQKRRVMIDELSRLIKLANRVKKLASFFDLDSKVSEVEAILDEITQAIQEIEPTDDTSTSH